MDNPTRAAIAETMAAAPRGERTATANRLARTYGVHVATIYRIADLRGAPRPRRPERPEYRGWVRIAITWSERGPKGKPVPIDQAIAAAIEAGDLPPEAKDMPVQTVRRLRRELDLNPRPKRTHRLHAEWPMQAVQLDASTSEYLMVDPGNDARGDATLLKLHEQPGPASGYKNKPLGPERLRVLVYGLWDMCTGMVRSRYTVARGETSLDALEFLVWALSPGADPRVVLHGVPEDLWVDQGPLVKSGPVRDLLERLDVNIVTGAPYAKERMGGVERAHRTRWARFERQLFLRPESLTLGDVNARLEQFELAESGRWTARTPVDGKLLSRAATWVALVNRRPADRPLRRMPENALDTLVREAKRKIDVNGIIRWGGVLYESTDWHERWVHVRRPLDGAGDDITIEDLETGEKRIARRYVPRSYGEVRSAPAAPLEKLRAVDAERDRKGADIFAPPTEPPAVVPLPARTAPAAPLENPLDGGRCRNLDEAMRLFVEHYPYALTATARAQVVAHIEQRGLERRAVIEAAQALANRGRQARGEA